MPRRTRASGATISRDVTYISDSEEEESWPQPTITTGRAKRKQNKRAASTSVGDAGKRNASTRSRMDSDLPMIVIDIPPTPPGNNASSSTNLGPKKKIPARNKNSRRNKSREEPVVVIASTAPLCDDESDVECVENDSNEVQKENINAEDTQIKSKPYEGFDPSIRFSDSDSDDLYSVDHEAIKASVQEDASQNYIKAQMEEERKEQHKQQEILRSIQSGELNPFSTSCDTSLHDVDSDSSLSSPDINEVKLSHRKMVKPSKKTQKLIDRINHMDKTKDKSMNDSMNTTTDAPDFEIIPTDEIMDIRLKYRLQYIKIPLKRNEKFGLAYQYLAEKFKVSFDCIVLSLRDEILSPDETPLGVNLSFTDIVELGITSSKEGESKSDSTISLKLQCSTRRGEVNLTMNKFEKMSTIMNKYALEKSLDVSKLKFVFDGEKLDSEDTPLTLDLEGGECIDVFPA